MKFVIEAIYILLVSFTFIQDVKSQDTKGEFTINGVVEGVPDSTIFYLITDNDGKADSIATFSLNGNFSFKEKWPNIGKLYFVKMDTTFVKLDAEKKSYLIVLMDNRLVNIVGTLDQWPNASVEGSPGTKEIEEYMHARQKPDKELNEALELAKNDSLKEDVAYENYSKFLIEFLDAHTNSYYAPLLMLNTQQILGLKRVSNAYSKLSENSKKGFYGVKLKTQIQFLEKKENILAGKEMSGRGTDLGELAFDIKGYTPDGNPLTLYEVVPKGKVTLIDFWASWCGPCRAELPNVREVYKKYHDKGFNVVSISVDKDPKAWKKALHEEALPWYHLSDMDKTKNSLSKELYKVSAIPMTFLLDSTGRIIATKVHGEKLFKEVSKVLD